MPVARVMGGPVDAEIVRVNVSSLSTAVSPYTFTKIVAEVTPAEKVSVPALASKSLPPTALPLPVAKLDGVCGLPRHI